MRKITVGIVQPKILVNHKANLEKLAASVERLAAKGANLIVLPELQNGPYFCQSENVEFFDLAEPVPGPSCEFYGKLTKKCAAVLVVTIFEKRASGLYHNTAAVFDTDGTMAGTYRKMQIPDDPGYYEKFYFTPGDTGFRPINTSIGRLGVQICWDQWYPEGARLMALQGAEILIYPTAIGYNSEDNEAEIARQREAWITVQRGHAVANNLHVVTVNRTGYEPDPSGATPGINFWGSSFICGPQGEMLQLAPQDEEVEIAQEIDLDRTEEVRRWWPYLRDRRIDQFQGLTQRFIDGTAEK